jgi:hypothetical protein
MPHKSRKNSCFEVLDGLFCELEASSVTWTYFMEAVIFFQFLVIKALDPDWIRIRIGLHPDPLDPDPDP